MIYETRRFSGKVELSTMWKRFLLTTAFASLFFVFAACDDDGSSVVEPGDESSSAICEDCDDSSSSVKSSSSVAPKSSESAKSSSSVIPASSGNLQSSSSKKESSSSAKSSSSVTPKSSSSETSVSSSNEKSSSSSVTPKSSSSLSSSSEYVPFDHSKAFDGTLWQAGAYKTFIDTRNGREYYYLEMEANGKSLKVMAENLNVGDMVKGYKNQQDDSKIERYCYDNDTTNCDRYGGLYQWAEMMQLPSECNTKSCADLIKPNHQGICPNGWRLMTAADFEFIVKSNGNKDGVEGTRSTFGFGGYNTTGFSLVGAGSNWDHSFGYLNHSTYWFYPEESSDDPNLYAFSSSQGRNEKYNPMDQVDKIHGFSVRCVMVE